MVDRRVDDVMRLSNRPRPKRARQEGGGPIVNELLENRVRGAPRERRSAIFRLIGCKKETLYRSQRRQWRRNRTTRFEREVRRWAGGINTGSL